MMSSLVPGSLFHTTGLNRNSTPTSATTTSDQLQRIYGREGFDGRQWPYDSPVHNVYDVRNTSTKMIILNNKYGQGSTRLRGYYTGPSIRKSERLVDPGRHSRVNSPRNVSHHQRCLESSSPYFEPDIKVDLEWVNQRERPTRSLSEESCENGDTPRRLDQARSAVNHKRHLHCQVPSATTYYTDSAGEQSPRPVSRMSRTSIPPRRFFKENADLTIGEKIYLWSIEKIYNLEHLKRLKQEQYQKLLELEAKKGQNMSWKDYDKYMRYIQSANTRHYGAKSPHSFRAKSAHSIRSGIGSPTRTKSLDDDESPSRPKTSESRPRSRKSVKKSDEKMDSQKKIENREEKQIENEKTILKSDETSEQTTSKSNENTTTTTTSLKTGDETRSKTPTKRPGSKNSQGDRPKSSASRKSAKSPSPYASPSPYLSRSPSARSSRSSRPSSYKSNKSKSGSVKSVGGDSEHQHKEGVDRPKSRLGHPATKNRGAYQLFDEMTYSDDSDFDDEMPINRIEQANNKTDSDKNSETSSDDKKHSLQNVNIHRVPSGNSLHNHDTSENSESSKTDSYQGETNEITAEKHEASEKDKDITNTSSNIEETRVGDTINRSDDDKADNKSDEEKQEMGILPARSMHSDDEDNDRGPNKDLDKIEY